jgi:molybdenum cofactor guanylyltransferase
MQAAGFVLVGGRSSRMGRDKALLQWNAHALVEEVAEKVGSVAGNVTLVGAPERYRGLGLACLPDIRRGKGPLAGIETALASGRAEWNLIAACDLPGMKAAWLGRLLRNAEESSASCVVLRDGNGVVHPLCGVYRAACLPAIRRALDENCLRLQSVTEELGAEMLDVESTLVNVNTPQDWIRWQRSAGAAGASHGD